MKFLVGTVLAFSLALPAFARDPLNPKEVDELREAKQMPNKRIELLVKYAKARMLAIQQVIADPKLSDRPQQIHDLLEDFNLLTDELDDNLDMYTREKADFRKSLKLAIEAYSDWQVNLRIIKEMAKPEELKHFSFSLETAIENVNAGADTTRELLAEQEVAKEKKKNKSDKQEKEEKASSEH
jgi:hypothetical protein